MKTLAKFDVYDIEPLASSDMKTLRGGGAPFYWQNFDDSEPSPREQALNRATSLALKKGLSRVDLTYKGVNVTLIISER